MKTNFPVTEQMINDWSDNLVNQPFNLDMETGKTKPVKADNAASKPCHGYLAAYVR